MLYRKSRIRTLYSRNYESFYGVTSRNCHAICSTINHSGEKRGKCQKLAKKPSLLTLHMQLYNMLIFQFPDWAIFDAVYSRYR